MLTLTKKVKAALALVFDYTARRLVRKGYLEQACHRYSLAAKLKPTAFRLLASAEIYFQLGEFAKANDAARQAIRIGAGRDLFAAWFLVALIDAKCDDLGGAIHALENARCIFPDDPQAIYALGSLLACNGELLAAESLFALDVAVATGTGTPTFTRALRFNHDPSRTYGKRKRSTQCLHEPGSPENSWKATYFVTADSVYFCRYAKALAGSVKLFGNQEILLHFHIVNPDSDAKQTLQAIIKNHTNVLATSETVDLSDLTEAQKKVYYSCARYLDLRNELSRGSVPVIVADMDQVLMADPQPLLDIAKAAEVVLLRFENQSHNLFSLLSATLMVITPSEGSSRFAEALTSRVEDAIRDRLNLTWHLDQGALVTTYLSMPDTRYGFIPPNMIHLDEGEPSLDRPPDVGVFWSITNSIVANKKKLESDLFLRLTE